MDNKKFPSFQIRYDKNGDSCSLISNGGQALKVKINREELSYRIVDLKTGMILVNGTAPSWSRIKVKIKQDIVAIFSIHPMGIDNLNVNRISTKRRRI